jgi:hypothetical protein
MYLWRGRKSLMVARSTGFILADAYNIRLVSQNGPLDSSTC